MRERVRPGYWIESDDARAAHALAVLKRIHDAVAPLAVGRTDEDLRVADYAAVRQAGYPAYLGGPVRLPVREMGVTSRRPDRALGPARDCRLDLAAACSDSKLVNEMP